MPSACQGNASRAQSEQAKQAKLHQTLKSLADTNWQMRLWHKKKDASHKHSDQARRTVCIYFSFVFCKCPTEHTNLTSQHHLLDENFFSSEIHWSRNCAVAAEKSPGANSKPSALGSLI
mmetsp:Transcript_51885/g.91149  ORF Transcript_51885/g.91149 Transcript_51885/m.91149 type:complete len:119 (+) Transcript_51885:69-425(+)